LTFSGDLGRRGMPILRPADRLPPARVVVCESTYGGTMHVPLEETVAQLIDVVRRTLARGGKILVPAFSLGRTQLVVYQLCEAMRTGKLTPTPIYVDSPLAADIAEIYLRHPECLQENCSPHAPREDCLSRSVRTTLDFLGSPVVRYVRDFHQS